ncbi:MAG: chromate transporter [Bacillota bacterium]
MLLKLFLSFLKIGAFSFGGGYAMIPLISREVVTSRAWLSMDEFVDVIALSEGTPGPIGINSATYVGFKIAGLSGSIAATAGVVLPSVVIMLALGYLFLKYREVGFVKDIFRGVRPVVVALVLSAAVSVAGATLTGAAQVVTAIVAAVAILRFNADPVLVLLASGILGYFIYL